MSEEQETLGSYLRRERKKRDVSIEQIAYATRISLKMLSALEEDQHELLPAQPFVRGYLQAYAKYVNLDPKDVLLRYQHHLATRPNREVWNNRPNIEDEDAGANEKRKLIWITAGFLVVLAGSGTYFWLKGKLQEENAKALNRAPVLKNIANPGIDALVGKSDNPAAKTIDPVADLAKVAPIPEKPGDAKPTPGKPEVKATDTPVSTTAAATAKPETKPAEEAKAEAEKTAATTAAVDDTPKKYNLSLKAKEDVWLRFQTDSDEIKDLILRKDKVITVRANKIIRMFSGNVKAMTGTLNGQELESLTQGDWKRSVVIPFSEIPNVTLPLFPGSGEGGSEAQSTAKKENSGERNSSTQ